MKKPGMGARIESLQRLSYALEAMRASLSRSEFPEVGLESRIRTAEERTAGHCDRTHQPERREPA
jgi:hypothetical protein